MIVSFSSSEEVEVRQRLTGCKRAFGLEGIYIDGGVFPKFASEMASESRAGVLWSVDLHSGDEQ